VVHFLKNDVPKRSQIVLYKNAVCLVHDIRTRNLSVMASMREERLYHHKVYNNAGNKEKFIEYLEEIIE